MVLIGMASHYTGSQVYGDKTALTDSVERRKDYEDEVLEISEGDHLNVLATASPSFRRKVIAARDSGRKWIHQVGRDSVDADIHRLQYVDEHGIKKSVTYLERNSAVWKRSHAR